ncbi:hypothetical protein BX667DRAFT_173939 [Coemansia mojavensis]|nr:hypothetical protein BX667DRAFT_173939 [Coemansia mojavensis]
MSTSILLGVNCSGLFKTPSVMQDPRVHKTPNCLPSGAMPGGSGLFELNAPAIQSALATRYHMKSQLDPGAQRTDGRELSSTAAQWRCVRRNNSGKYAGRNTTACLHILMPPRTNKEREGFKGSGSSHFASFPFRQKGFGANLACSVVEF